MPLTYVRHKTVYLWTDRHDTTADVEDGTLQNVQKTVESERVVLLRKFHLQRKRKRNLFFNALEPPPLVFLPPSLPPISGQ